MSESNVFEKSVLDFRDEYLRSRRDVSIFRRLRVYSRGGLYATGIFSYITIGLYFSEGFAWHSIQVVGFGIVSVAIGMLTVLFRINKAKKYDFSHTDLVFHEIAAFIDNIENRDTNELPEGTEQFNDRVIDDDEGVLPKVWRDELSEYFDYLDEADDVDTEELNRVFSQLVDDINEFSGVDLSEEYSREMESESKKEEAGFITVLSDTISSDIISGQTLIWIIFVLAVAGGLVLAFFQGQGWGVLLVTIVFGGLRLYDQRSD